MARSGPAGIEWYKPPSTLAEATEQYYRGAMEAIWLLGDYYAAMGERKMKLGRVWTDRTTVAWASLYGRSIPNRDGVTIIYGHGPNVSYGIFLELAHGGRYAIVIPTYRTMTPIVIRGMQALFR